MAVDLDRVAVEGDWQDFETVLPVDDVIQEKPAAVACADIEQLAVFSYTKKDVAGIVGVGAEKRECVLAGEVRIGVRGLREQRRRRSENEEAQDEAMKSERPETDVAQKCPSLSLSRLKWKRGPILFFDLE